MPPRSLAPAPDPLDRRPVVGTPAHWARHAAALALATAALPTVSACSPSPTGTEVLPLVPPPPSVLGTPVHAVLVPVLPDETRPTVEDCRWIRLRGTTLGELGDMNDKGRLRLHAGVEPGPVCDGLVTAAGQACNGSAPRCVGSGSDWLQVEHGSSETWTDMGGPYEWRRGKYEVKLVARDGREPLLLVARPAVPENAAAALRTGSILAVIGPASWVRSIEPGAIDLVVGGPPVAAAWAPGVAGPTDPWLAWGSGNGP